MKKELTEMKTRTIEDVERAAWYARLAFGIYREKESTPPAPPEKSKQIFYVIP